MDDMQSKVCYPGLCLGSTIDFQPLGTNLYVYNEKIFSGVKGNAVFKDGTVEVQTGSRSGNKGDNDEWMEPSS